VRHLDVIGFGAPLRGMREVAATAERLGFAGCWLTEGGRSAFTGATAAALATDSMTVGTGVAVAFARSPMVTAQVAWELAEATGGRFVLGLGTQVRAHVERRYSAAFDRPGPRMREYVAALRAIFRAFRGAAPLRFSGDFYAFSLLPREWSPGPIDPPDPPIYVAGVNPWMLTMIGEVADGIHVHPLHSVRYLDEVVRPALRAGAARAGRRAEDLAVVCPVMTIPTDDEREWTRVREEVRMRLAFYGSTPGYGGVFEQHGWHGTAERLRELRRAGDPRRMAAAVTDEMVDAFAVSAPWDGLADALADRYRGRADRVICYSAVPQWRDPAAVDRWAAVAARARMLAEGRSTDAQRT
jgi:probable F420-dependent oxidoreductase